MTINSIQAAKIEAEGQGILSAVGRNVILRTNDGYEVKWSCRSEKMAREHLRMFRASQTADLHRLGHGR